MGWENTYQRLCDYLVDNAVLASTNALLGWDELTYMPPKGASGRAKQMSVLARMTHERFIAPDVGKQLDELAASDLDADAHANVREWRRLYQREVKVPSTLVEEMTRTAVMSRQAWGEAKNNSHFDTFKPWLQKTIDLRRQLASCLCGRKPETVEELYDSLLDEYEPCETTQRLRQMFAQLRPRLVQLIQKVQASARKPHIEILHRHYPIDRQKAFAEATAKEMGFDDSAGRLDTTLHPFCTTISPGDVRITTRYDERDFGNCFFSVIHETGHALYEQGLPPAKWGMPLGEAVSLGVHESQSRLWENLVGRSEAFWTRMFPKAQQAFPEALKDVKLEEFVFAINAIRPSLIRTEADETTYNLHIILRFELEQLLLSGDLPVDELPATWNLRMLEYLGVEVPDDAHGCLQDVHWSQGGFGYFPTYSLGNLNASALLASARSSIPDLDCSIEHGDFSAMLAWLRQHVHQHGKRYPARELMRRATGDEVSIDPLIAHLAAKVERYYVR